MTPFQIFKQQSKFFSAKGFCFVHAVKVVLPTTFFICNKKIWLMVFNVFLIVQCEWRIQILENIPLSLISARDSASPSQSGEGPPASIFSVKYRRPFLIFVSI
jgi:hypothetical protein